MLTPTVLSVVTPFYAVGNTPAVSLTRCLPQGVDADILLLGCGDVRHILYTAYAEKGFPSRKLDITCCDIQDAIIARNVLLLSLLVAQRRTTGSQVLWNVYYHLFLDDDSAKTLQEHVDVLLELSTSAEKWRDGQFGDMVIFSDQATLASVRNVWKEYANCLSIKDAHQYRNQFEAALKRSRDFKDAVYGRDTIAYGGARAAAPLGMKTMADAEFHTVLNAWWKTGTTGNVPENTNIPNPLFAAHLSQNSVLAYGDPILSFHLAAAKAHLAEMSPLRPSPAAENGNSISTLVAAAQLQFSEWTTAFVEMASGRLVIRFTAADAFALCHTIQHRVATGKTSGHFYRRQLSSERLVLDPEYYGQEAKAPMCFDVIDTSNMSDYYGVLNILISTSQLLKNVPWATLYTETMEKGKDGERRKFEELLCGPARTVSTLLGISPAEYWTNATASSSVDEYMVAITLVQEASQQPSIEWRFGWKLNQHLNGKPLGTFMKVKDADAATLIHKVYQNMFISEDAMSMLSLSRVDQSSLMKKQMMPRYHRGSLVAFMKSLFRLVDVNRESVCQQFLKIVSKDFTIMLGSNFLQSLALGMAQQGLYSMPRLFPETRQVPAADVFATWPDVPMGVAVTISIPPDRWRRVYEVALQERNGFTVEGSIRGMRGGVVQWHNVFADVQVVFGTVQATGTRDSDEFSVSIQEDERKWSGDSPMIASFYVPTKALQVDPEHTKVALCLQNSLPSMKINTKLQLGQPMSIYETDLKDHNHVFITRYQPGQDGVPLFNRQDSEDVVPPTPKDARHTSYFAPEMDSSGVITTINGHLDVLSEDSKKLLADKAVVEVIKVSPFVFEVVLGKREAVHLLHFPVPVSKEGSKTRIARKSSYVEIIAPLADAVTSQALDDFIFPCTLAASRSTPTAGQLIPVTLNIPHINLDVLPIIDASDKDRLKFLTTLTSWTFSARERKLREEVAQSSKAGLASSARLNFKESLFTMFMISSGLQGGQTGLFAITHPEKGGIHMLIFISALRIDGPNASVVLDGAVLPFTLDLIKSGRLDSFLLLLRTLECCTVTVDDAELSLWKKVIPALVERCRNWSHAPDCEYARPGAAVPLNSTELGAQVICGCGAGRLPDSFINLPEWDTAAQFATRLAISPTYAVPYVEEVVDPELAKGAVGAVGAVGVGAGAGAAIRGDASLRCLSCGKTEARGGGALKKCTRCMKAKYCSAECQRNDWKKHRMECD